MLCVCLCVQKVSHSLTIFLSTHSSEPNLTGNPIPKLPPHLLFHDQTGEFSNNFDLLILHNFVCFKVNRLLYAQ